VTLSGGELADRVELRALVDAYAQAADARDSSALLRLFAPDATFVAHQRWSPDPLRDLRGRDQLGSLLDGLAVFEETQHLMINHHIASLGREDARGSVDAVAHHLLDRGNGTEDLVMHLRYADLYTRVSGSWCFAERAMRIRWAAWRALEQTALAV
jgi:hypothetical protein